MSEPSAAPTASLVARFALPPEEIEERSLSAVAASLGDRFSNASEEAVAARILYAAGDVDLGGLLRFSPGAVAAGVRALQNGSQIVVDVQMVAAGVDDARVAALGCAIHCAINDQSVVSRARLAKLPRAVEAMRALAPLMDGAVIVIGNAPTALLSVIDLLDAGAVSPTLVVGMPVGFVAAAEAKEELAKRNVPYLTIAGTRGGSPLATAALNALLRLALPTVEVRDRSDTAVLFAGHGSRAPGAAEAMLAAVDNVRRRGLFPIVETGYLEMVQPDLPAALRSCIEQGATRVLVVPYFLHYGMHIRRDIPAVLRRELELHLGVSVSIGRPIGLHADLANVMIAGALEAETMPELGEQIVDDVRR